MHRTDAEDASPVRSPGYAGGRRAEAEDAADRQAGRGTEQLRESSVEVLEGERRWWWYEGKSGLSDLESAEAVNMAISDLREKEILLRNFMIIEENQRAVG